MKRTLVRRARCAFDAFVRRDERESLLFLAGQSEGLREAELKLEEAESKVAEACARYAEHVALSLPGSSVRDYIYRAVRFGFRHCL